MAREDLVQGLRDLADFLEDNEEVPVGEYASVDLYEYVYDEYTEDTEDAFGVPIEGSALKKMKSLARLLKPCKKNFSGNTFNLVKKFGEHVTLEFSTARSNVCKRIVVGTEEVPERIQKAHTREIVEWECNDPLLR